MVERYRFRTGSASHTHQGFLSCRNGDLEVSIPSAEVHNVLFRQFRPVAHDAKTLRRMSLPVAWQVRLARLLDTGVISHVYYSARIGVKDGVELRLPEAQAAERPAQLRRLGIHWGSSTGCKLRLGCFGRADSTGLWYKLSICHLLLFSSPSAQQPVECSQQNTRQLSLLSLPGQSFVSQLLQEKMAVVRITPAAGYCRVDIGTHQRSPEGVPQLLRAAEHALEDTLGISLLK